VVAIHRTTPDSSEAWDRLERSPLGASGTMGKGLLVFHSFPWSTGPILPLGSREMRDARILMGRDARRA
jgi:hypothetical protein